MMFDSNWHLDMESRIWGPRSERLVTYSKYNLRDIESTCLVLEGMEHAPSIPRELLTLGTTQSTPYKECFLGEGGAPSR